MTVLPGGREPEGVEVNTKVTVTLAALVARSSGDITNDEQLGVVNKVQSNTINTGSVRHGELADAQLVFMVVNKSFADM